MTGKKRDAGKKKEVDFTVRPRAAKEELPSTAQQWIERGKGAAAQPAAQPEKTKRLTLDLPAELHTAFKGWCVLKGVTIQDKVRLLIERELADGRTPVEPDPGPGPS